MDSTSCAVAELMRSLEKHYFLSNTLTRAHDRARSSSTRIKFKVNVKYALEQSTKAQKGSRDKSLLFL